MADINDLKEVLTKRNWKTLQGQLLKSALENMAKTINTTTYENIADSTKQAIIELLNCAIKLLDRPNDTTNKTGFSDALNGWKEIKNSDDSTIFSALRDPVRNLVKHVNDTTELPKTKLDD